MELRAVNRRVHADLQRLVSEGADDETLATVLFAYSLNLAFKAHGRAWVADHLRGWCEAFTSGQTHTFEDIVRQRHKDRSVAA